MKRFLEEARKLIRINSITSNGNEELANYIAALLQDRGLKTQLQQVTHSLEDLSKRQFNVIGVIGDPLVDKKIRKGLLLNTHLDTVSPGIPENWSETGGDPFAATIKDGKIFGLGAAAAKLDFLCKVYAVEKFRERKLKMPIYLVGTCGEEQGMFGVRYLIKSMSLNPKYVIVGEPTGLKLVHAHKSLHIHQVSIGYQQVERDARGFNRRIDLHSFGRSSHGAYPGQGNNAVLSTFDFLRRASDHGFQMRFTRLDGGDVVNRVPDRSVVQFYLSSQQFEDFKRFFRETIKGERERTFRVELGGVGDAGVKFLPENLFPCLSEVVKLFQDLSEEFAGVRDEAFNPPVSTVNLGLMKQRMSGLDLQFDLRLLPTAVQAEVETKVLQGIQAIAARYPSLNVSTARKRSSPGLTMGKDQEFVSVCKEALKAADIEPELATMPTTTEAAQYFQAGYEALVFGPGIAEGNSHSPNEHNLIEQMERAVLFYEKLIERVCT